MLAQQVSESLGAESTLRGLSYRTDAGRLVPVLGIPFVIWGPGDDNAAHQIDEKIEIASICRMAERYLLLAKTFGA